MNEVFPFSLNNQISIHTYSSCLYSNLQLVFFFITHPDHNHCFPFPSKMSLKLQLHFHHISPFKFLNLPSPSQSHSPLRFHAPNNTFTISSKLFHVASKRRSIRILKAQVVGSNELTDESKDEECSEEMGEKKELADQSVWNQMKEIVKFTGPAMGLWLCDPLMSLIDTAVVGQGSSTELAALGIQQKTTVSYILLNCNLCRSISDTILKYVVIFDCLCFLKL